MSETIITLIGVPVMMLALASLLVGFVVICTSIWGSTGWGVRRAERKRNAIPDTPIEQAIRACINLMVESPDNWQTEVVPTDSYYQSKERVSRKDSKVIFRNYQSKNSLRIDMVGIGSFEGDSIKPELRERMAYTCQNFKQLVAVHQMLEPSKLLD